MHNCDQWARWGEHVSRTCENGPGKIHTFVGSYKLPLGQYMCIGWVVACSFQHMGPTAPTGRTHAQHAPNFHNDTLHVRVCIPLGPTWLQCKPLCTTGMQSWGTPHPRSLQDMGTPHSKQILRGQCMGALLLPWSLHQWHQEHLHMLNGLLQTQVLNHANLYPIWHSHSRDRLSHGCYLRPKSHTHCHNWHTWSTTGDLEATSAWTRDAATAQRVLRELAQVEWVIHKEHQQQVAPSYPQLEVEHTFSTSTPPGIPQITQDDQDLPPSANTRQQQDTLTLT